DRPRLPVLARGDSRGARRPCVLFRRRWQSREHGHHGPAPPGDLPHRRLRERRGAARVGPRRAAGGGRWPAAAAVRSAAEGSRPEVASPTPPPPVAPASAPFRHDQVFEPHAFFELIDRLWGAHRAGGSALCPQRGLAVRDNPRFGIQGVGPVDVLWVYNAPVAAFRDRLGDIVRLGMDADPLLYGRFPNYDT